MKDIWRIGIPGDPDSVLRPLEAGAKATALITVCSDILGLFRATVYMRSAGCVIEEIGRNKDLLTNAKKNRTENYQRELAAAPRVPIPRGASGTIGVGTQQAEKRSSSRHDICSIYLRWRVWVRGFMKLYLFQSVRKQGVAYPNDTAIAMRQRRPLCLSLFWGIKNSNPLPHEDIFNLQSRSGESSVWSEEDGNNRSR